MSKYCIVLSLENYLHVFEPFLRRRHLRLPALMLEKKVAVYIKRACVLHLLDEMAKTEIGPSGAIANAFRSCCKIDDSYSLDHKTKNRLNQLAKSNLLSLSCRAYSPGRPSHFL